MKILLILFLMICISAFSVFFYFKGVFLNIENQNEALENITCYSSRGARWNLGKIDAKSSLNKILFLSYGDSVECEISYGSAESAYPKVVGYHSKNRKKSKSLKIFKKGQQIDVWVDDFKLYTHRLNQSEFRMRNILR